MRAFILMRPEIVRQHFLKTLDLPGTATLTFDPPSLGVGSVLINGDRLPQLPWQGIYFVGTPVQIAAIPAPGYRFVGWEQAPSVAQVPAITVTIHTTTTMRPCFEAVEQTTYRPGDATSR